MQPLSASKRSRPPHNPGLRDLIQGKREGSPPLNQEAEALGFRGWHERGYLPHRDEPGMVQLVTFRVRDSFPAALRAEWAHLLEIEDNRKRREQLETYLDRGDGECPLRRAELAELVDGTLRINHGRTYELRAWVVMPNHVHALFKTFERPMGQVIADWKEFTARESNKLLGRKGGFWAKDYWDTFMRDGEHELRARRYVENNPTKAGLVREPKAWRWSSARLRDAYGNLKL